MLAQARRRTLRLARQVTDRLPVGAQRGIRKGWHRLRPYAGRVFYSRPLSPLVSIVIPVYNVERYLPDCLDSVLSQSYPHLEVILVDDGSPDRSIDIMRAYADRDHRIKIVRQPNAGLGAARNTGARHARGTFLMFVDSDDVLRPDAIRTYVRTLRRTQSDFAVGLYDRMNSHETWQAAPWVRATHRLSRLGTTLAESPDAVVNAVACSKVFRRKFWEENGFAFPEGVLYEDQALSTRAYAKAARFDILARVTYGWRVREDRTSITQQSTTTRDLRARLRAAENSLAELDGPGLEHVRNTRLAQYLNNDFPLSIKTAQFADDEFWELLTAALQRLTSRAGPDVWNKVSAQHRLAIKLVTSGHRQEVIDFVGLGHNNPKNIPALVADGHIYLQTPAREVLGLGPTDPLLALADHQLGLVSRIRRAYWDEQHRYHVEGWAYIDNLDLAQADPASIRTDITAVEQTSGVEVALDVEIRPSPEVTAASRHRHANYEASCFHAVLDVPAALAQLDGHPDVPDPGASDWTLRTAVSAAGIERTALLAGPEAGGSASRLLADHLPDGRLVEASYSGRTGLLLSVRRPRCTVAGVELDGRNFTVSVSGTEQFAPHELQLTGNRSKQVLRVPLTQDGDGPTRGTFSLPAPGADPKTGEPLRAESWTVRVVAADGNRSPAAWPDAADHPELTRENPRPQATQYGNLGIVDEPAVIWIDEATVTEEGLSIGGTVIGIADTEDRSNPIVLRLQTPKVRTQAVARRTGPDRFTAVLPLVADPWGLGALPLPVGDYGLTATIGSEPEQGSGDRVTVRMTDALISRLPIMFRTEQLLGRIRLAKPNLLTVRLEIPLADDERGSRQQERLQDGLRARLEDPHHEPGAVLLRSYYGEICGCNPLALQRYLHDHDVPGGPYTTYFAIKDYSVRVPEGAVPVIYESAEWYRLLHDAQYYMDNMHQPIYHKKPAHQIQIQTFHGYPFKQMGQSHWAMQNRDVAHVRSYLDRAADWDYLVSPASYGTQALTREFGFPNTVLEIGYPRNDVLLSPGADKITAQVRERLGIRPGQTAVLYGPTFRDSMSKDDNTARMVDFLDLDRLAENLGEDFAIMVRGHAYNARLGTRIGSRGTIIDVTDYPDIADLCLASDAAILDYSSLRFDYGLTGKPMIFMVPDLVQYQTEARGSLWAYEPTAPGPLLSTTDEVITALSQLDRVRSDYAEAYAAFRKDFLDLDDGHATERLVRAVFPHTAS